MTKQTFDTIPDSAGASAKTRRSWLSMTPVILLGFIIVVVIPVLEINDSHLFNPDWPPHARLHEAWQLGTNAGIALMAIWMTLRGQNRLACGLSLLIVVPLLMAYAVRHAYGGSMSRDGLNDTIASISGLPVIVILLIAVSLLPGLMPTNADKI